ncbi:MAG: cation diffusion facilitator family transporter, partial [Halobacteriaceae archaeon]
GFAGTTSAFGFKFPSVWVNYVVLLGAIAFEGYAFQKAHTNMSAQIEKHQWKGFVEAFRKTSDVTVLTALTEDTIALMGAFIALVGIFLTRFTGNPMYDAVAATLIGLLLMGFAIALAWENKRLLLGESLPPSEESKLQQLIRDHEGVLHVDEFRSVYFGPEEVIITTDVSFEPEMDTVEIDESITAIENKLQSFDDRLKKIYIEPEM